jgi:hypothetical protein
MIRVSILVFWPRGQRISPVWSDCRLCDYLSTFLGGDEPFPTPTYNDGWFQMGSFHRRTAFSIKGGGELTKHRIIRALQARWKRWYVTLIPPNFCFWRHITRFWRHIMSSLTSYHESDLILSSVSSAICDVTMVPRLISFVKVATYIKKTESVASKQRHSLVNAEKLWKGVRHWTRIGSIDLESDDTAWNQTRIISVSEETSDGLLDILVPTTTRHVPYEYVVL